MLKPPCFASITAGQIAWQRKQSRAASQSSMLKPPCFAFFATLSVLRLWMQLMTLWPKSVRRSSYALRPHKSIVLDTDRVLLVISIELCLQTGFAARRLAVFEDILVSVDGSLARIIVIHRVFGSTAAHVVSRRDILLDDVYRFTLGRILHVVQVRVCLLGIVERCLAVSMPRMALGADARRVVSVITFRHALWKMMLGYQMMPCLPGATAALLILGLAVRHQHAALRLDAVVVAIAFVLRGV